MSVANISTTLPGTVSAFPVRTADAVEGRALKQGDGVVLPHASAHEQPNLPSGLPADRFDPSTRALGGHDSAQSAQTAKEEKAKAFERELAAIQQAAAQTRYGVNGSPSSPSISRDFESLLMAVSSGDITSAEKALTRLQGASTEVNAAQTAAVQSAAPTIGAKDTVPRPVRTKQAPAELPLLSEKLFNARKTSAK